MAKHVPQDYLDELNGFIDASNSLGPLSYAPYLTRVMGLWGVLGLFALCLFVSLML